MGKLCESIIYVTHDYWKINDATYMIYHEDPFSKITLREAMRTGKNIIINDITSEMNQIIRYNNGYLEHKYKIRYL